MSFLGTLWVAVENKKWRVGARPLEDSRNLVKDCKSSEGYELGIDRCVRSEVCSFII